MPSNAFASVLLPLIADIHELTNAHKSLRTGRAGRQWGLGGLNRAAVVMAVSTWEGFVEAILLEAVNALRPLGPAPGGAAGVVAPPPAPGSPAAAAAVVASHWQALAAQAQKDVNKFNTPNSSNVNNLFKFNIGVPRVSTGWRWQACTMQQAEDALDALVLSRHAVAHGVNPRPAIHNGYARWLPGFVKRLAEKTDTHLASEMTRLYGVTPW